MSAGIAMPHDRPFLEVWIIAIALFAVGTLLIGAHRRYQWFPAVRKVVLHTFLFVCALIVARKVTLVIWNIGFLEGELARAPTEQIKESTVYIQNLAHALRLMNLGLMASLLTVFVASELRRRADALGARLESCGG